VVIILLIIWAGRAHSFCTMSLTPELSRAARAFLGWSQDLLAEKAGVGVSTVRDFERGVRVPIKQNLLALERAFSGAGVDLEKLRNAFGAN